MKTLKCYDCDDAFEAADRADMLNQFYKHYMSEHQATIMGADDAEKKRWMEQFERDWAAA